MTSLLGCRHPLPSCSGDTAGAVSPAWGRSASRATSFHPPAVGVPLLSLAREKLAKRGAAGVRTLRVRAGLRAFVDSPSMDWQRTDRLPCRGRPAGFALAPHREPRRWTSTSLPTSSFPHKRESTRAGARLRPSRTVPPARGSRASARDEVIRGGNPVIFGYRDAGLTSPCIPSSVCASCCKCCQRW